MLWVLIRIAHNIGFYEEISKIIFELSSNIIKYAPYFFCCTSLFGTLKTVFSREEARMQPHMSFGVLDIILVVMVCLGVLSK